MNAIAERIPHLQNPRQSMRQRADDRHFKPQPPVIDERREDVALAQQAPGALRERVQTLQKLRRRAWRAERPDGGVASGKAVLRNVDAIKIEIILLAVLQVIDDLQ